MVMVKKFLNENKKNMTTLDSSKEIQKNNYEANETHEDFRMFGLITFLIADGMTFAGFFAAYFTY